MNDQETFSLNDNRRSPWPASIFDSQEGRSSLWEALNCEPSGVVEKKLAITFFMENVQKYLDER